MFLLSAEDGAAVQQLVVQLLGDKKLEVQELAARTLSGLIQVRQAQILCKHPNLIPSRPKSAHFERRVSQDRSVPFSS